MNTDTPLDFLQSLFTSLDSEEVYLAPADAPELSYAVASLDDAARYIEEEKARGVFISTGTFRPGTARQQEHLRCVPVIILDADMKDALESEGVEDAEAKVRRCSEATLTKLRKTHLNVILDTLARAGIENPSAVAFSGGGHHIYLLIDCFDQGEIARIRAVHAKLVHRLNESAKFKLFDPQVVDSGTRFIRVPGTANTRCVPIRWAEVVQNSGPTFTLEQLENVAGIQPEQPQDEPEQPHDEQASTSGDPDGIVRL